MNRLVRDAVRQISRLVVLAAGLSPWATPPANAALVPAEPEHVLSLNGTWRFKLERASEFTAPLANWNLRSPITTPAVFEPFYTTGYKEGDGWRDLGAPGNWDIAGYSPATYNQPDNASGFYRFAFDVPAAWKGRKVLLNFDGVQNGAEVFFNGQPTAGTAS